LPERSDAEAAECGDKPSRHPEQLIAQVEPTGQK
jgi:hypothetical protein